MHPTSLDKPKLSKLVEYLTQLRGKINLPLESTPVPYGTYSLSETSTNGLNYHRKNNLKSILAP